MNDYNDEIDGRIRTQLGLSQLNGSIGYFKVYAYEVDTCFYNIARIIYDVQKNR
jgi:hypothetical protein